MAAARLPTPRSPTRRTGKSLSAMQISLRRAWSESGLAPAACSRPFSFLSVIVITRCLFLLLSKVDSKLEYFLEAESPHPYPPRFELGFPCLTTRREPEFRFAVTATDHLL